MYESSNFSISSSALVIFKKYSHLTNDLKLCYKFLSFHGAYLQPSIVYFLGHLWVLVHCRVMTLTCPLGRMSGVLCVIFVVNAINNRALCPVSTVLFRCPRVSDLECCYWLLWTVFIFVGKICRFMARARTLLVLFLPHPDKSIATNTG